MGGWWSGLMHSQEEHEAEQLAERLEGSGADPIAGCQRGRPARVCGTIRSVAIRPRAKTPTLEAEVYDGTGHLTLVWLGRRHLAGVEVGRMIEASGRVTCPADRPVMFNPSYSLLLGGAE